MAMNNVKLVQQIISSDDPASELKKHDEILDRLSDIKTDVTKLIVAVDDMRIVQKYNYENQSRTDGE